MSNVEAGKDIATKQKICQNRKLGRIMLIQHLILAKKLLIDFAWPRKQQLNPQE